MQPEIYYSYGKRYTQMQLRTSRKKTLLPCMECWWHSDSAHVSHHCDLGSIPAPCSYLIKVTLVTCEKSIVIQFDFTKHHRFSPGTPVSSCSNSGRTAQVADRIIQYK